ncbi:hypothetical protein KI387_008848, partial [Taxus chinensis]
RVLDSGFIDGEMKVYRHDVAWVGVGLKNGAVQAVQWSRRLLEALLLLLLSLPWPHRL